LPGRGAILELRLTGGLDGPLAGAGDWRTPTERRAAPPPLAVGDVLLFHASCPIGHVPGDIPELRAELIAVDPRAARLLPLRFDRSDAALWSALYRVGRLVDPARRAMRAPRPSPTPT